jgi:hemoglobin
MSDSPRLVRLPLTEASPAGEARVGAVTSGTIAAIVDDFYGRCRADPLLGPVFNSAVTDWPSHLARIRSFWEAAVLRQPGYAGRPLEAHLDLPVSREHFSAWLRLWKATVESHCTPEDAAVFMMLAGRMANRMMGAAKPEP